MAQGRRIKMNVIIIASVVDVVEALANDSVAASLYLVDNNKANGSRDEGTSTLKTSVRKGDQLYWMAYSLECETYLSITRIEIDKQYCDPEELYYPDTDISFWTGKIKKDIEGAVPYIIAFHVGTPSKEMSIADTPEACPCLVSAN
jgi:hypothetical protein